jgi:hypothetical protein
MGYRSEVGFFIQFNKDPEEFVALMKVDGRDIFKDFMRYMYIDMYPEPILEEDAPVGGVHFYHNSWKWYEDSRIGFTELLEMAENYDEEFKAKFARTGEESDDTEEEWFNDDGYELEYPYVVRMVDTGIKLDKLKKVSEDASD